MIQLMAARGECSAPGGAWSLPWALVRARCGMKVGGRGTPPEISRGVEATASTCFWGGPSTPDSKPPGLGVQTPGWDGQAGGKGPQSP